MLRSMGLIAGIVLVMAVLVWRPVAQPEIQSVDAAAIATGVASDADFSLLVPALPAGWKVTSARLSKVAGDVSNHVWHVGYVSPAGDYFAIEQTDTLLPDVFLAQFNAGKRSASEVKLAGQTWQKLAAADGGLLLYRNLTNSMLLIVGEDSAELGTFIESISK